MGGRQLDATDVDGRQGWRHRHDATFGRPVEIQALWYNALRTVEELGREFGDSAFADYCAGVANRLRANFSACSGTNPHCLFDMVSESGPDASLRPNQVIAVSLRHRLLSEEKALAVLKAAEGEC